MLSCFRAWPLAFCKSKTGRPRELAAYLQKWQADGYQEEYCAVVSLVKPTNAALKDKGHKGSIDKVALQLTVDGRVFFIAATTVLGKTVSNKRDDGYTICGAIDYQPNTSSADYLRVMIHAPQATMRLGVNNEDAENPLLLFGSGPPDKAEYFAVRVFIRNPALVNIRLESQRFVICSQQRRPIQGSDPLHFVLGDGLPMEVEINQQPNDEKQQQQQQQEEEEEEEEKEKEEEKEEEENECIADESASDDRSADKKRHRLLMAQSSVQRRYQQKKRTAKQKHQKTKPNTAEDETCQGDAKRMRFSDASVVASNAECTDDSSAVGLSTAFATFPVASPLPSLADTTDVSIPLPPLPSFAFSRCSSGGYMDFSSLPDSNSIDALSPLLLEPSFSSVLAGGERTDSPLPYRLPSLDRERSFGFSSSPGLSLPSPFMQPCPSGCTSPLAF